MVSSPGRSSMSSTLKGWSAPGPAGPGADQPFKVELIEDLPGEETISVYTQGDFIDLCRGPHLPSTSRLGNGTFKLTSLAGAYWRGDENKPMLTRVYGTAFATTGASAATSISSASTRRAPASPSSTPRACVSGTRWSTSGAPSTCAPVTRRSARR